MVKIYQMLKKLKTNQIRIIAGDNRLQLSVIFSIPVHFQVPSTKNFQQI